MTDEEWQAFVWEQSRRVERENRARGLPKLEWRLGELRWVDPKEKPTIAPNQLERVED